MRWWVWGLVVVVMAPAAWAKPVPPERFAPIAELRAHSGTLGTLEVQGALTKEVVRRQLRGRDARVRACFGGPEKADKKWTFDLSFSVARGETLALLGTNGAGKSTILKVITGLGTPQRGVVRMHGRTITYSTPEQRAAMGIQMLPGGKGTFQNLTIGDNLIVGAYRYRHDHADVQRRIDRVLELFPSLADRLHERAGDLSGGQQQMLALARVMLHDPDVLIIDELSLGLAPTVVQDLLVTIDRLKDAGQTMIIVEQSLNVALAIADRAVFLEKGQVRFEGSAQELAERDDLARAVFLGTEGG